MQSFAIILKIVAKEIPRFFRRFFCTYTWSNDLRTEKNR